MATGIGFCQVGINQDVILAGTDKLAGLIHKYRPESIERFERNALEKTADRREEMH